MFPPVVTNGEQWPKLWDPKCRMRNGAFLEGVYLPIGTGGWAQQSRRGSNQRNYSLSLKGGLDIWLGCLPVNFWQRCFRQIPSTGGPRTDPCGLGIPWCTPSIAGRGVCAVEPAALWRISFRKHINVQVDVRLSVFRKQMFWVRGEYSGGSMTNEHTQWVAADQSEGCIIQKHIF